MNGSLRINALCRGVIVAVGSAAATCSAQTPTLTVSIAEFVAPRLGATSPVPTESFDAGADYLAFRLTLDYAEQSGITPTDSARVMLLDASSGQALTQTVRFLNAGGNETRELDLVAAGTFETNPAVLPAVDLLVEARGSLGGSALVSNIVLELFVGEDIPHRPFGGGPLVGTAPGAQADLGIVGLAGRTSVFDASATAEAIPTLFAGDGTPSALRAPNTPLGSDGDNGVLRFVGDEIVDVLRDGSLGYTTLVAGEYLVAVTNGDIERLGDGFFIDPDTGIGGDAVLSVNGVVSTVAEADAVGDTAWYAITIAPVSGDFDDDGNRDAADIGAFLEAADRGVTDFNGDGGVDIFDALGFLAAFDA